MSAELTVHDASPMISSESPHNSLALNIALAAGVRLTLFMATPAEYCALRNALPRAPGYVCFASNEMLREIAAADDYVDGVIRSLTVENEAEGLQTKGETEMTDWYERRSDLAPGQIFRTREGSVVRLDYRTPGDGTKWTVADWFNGWAHYDSTVEPGDLEERLSDDWNGKPA